MKINPNFYAVIPANVRYADITPNAKLLYGEITALCSKEGFCWAGNPYFAELYKVNRSSIKRWMSELEQIGVIKIEGSTNKRHISLGSKITQALGSKLQQTRVKNELDSNTVLLQLNNVNSSKDEFESVFDLKAEIQKLKKDSRRHIQLIGEYFEEKKLEFSNKKELSQAIKRHVRDAAALADFGDDKIGRATEEAEKEYPKYTLGTLVKILTR